LPLFLAQAGLHDASTQLCKLPSRKAVPATHCPSTTYKVEAAGIEPSDDFDATSEGPCNCENCQQCRAANALHSECVKRHLLASFDIDLQRLIAVWNLLDVEVRGVIVASAEPVLRGPSATESIGA
jgi:hypothetical protein